MDQLFVQLPKIELHAHLSGSISQESLSRLLHEKGQSLDEQLPILAEGNTRHISRCFDLFKIIHKTINCPEVVKRVTVDVVEEFAAENVVYLELRTTLRPLPTCRDYLNAVIVGLTGAPSVLSKRIVTRLLVSIDRARGVDEAEQAIALAIEAAQSWPDLVVGVDLSGNPEIGSLLDYVPMLNQARTNGLKTTVHLAEIPDQAGEWLQFLRQHIPDRLGHVTCLPHSVTVHTSSDAAEARQIVVNERIPLEICLTSNVRTQTVRDYESHHLRHWLQLGQPLCLCTDDKGVFDSRLSDEFRLAVEYCGLTETDVFRLCDDAISSAFCPPDVKLRLREQVNAFRAQLPRL